MGEGSGGQAPGGDKTPSLEEFREREKTVVQLVRLLDGFVEEAAGLVQLPTKIKALVELFGKPADFPDAEKARTRVSGLAASVRKGARTAMQIRSFLEGNAVALRAAGLASRLNSLPPEHVLAQLTVLADALDDLAKGIRAAEFPVYANDGWQRSDVRASEGDLIYVKAEGAWRIGRDLPETSAQGFERKALERIAAGKFTMSVASVEGRRLYKANLGCLLLRVRGSEAVAAAVGTHATKADVDGPLEFRVNEREAKDNSGVVRASVVVVAGDKLVSLLEAADRMGLGSPGRARMSMCASGIKQIGYACHLYAGDFGGRFPTSLDKLFPSYVPDAKVFTCPGAQKATPVAKLNLDGMDPADFARNHCDFGYVSGLKPTSAPASVLAFDKKGNHEGGRHVLYVGSKVAWRTEAAFQEDLRRTLEMARKTGRDTRVIE